MSKTIITFLWGILGIITMPLWGLPFVLYVLGVLIQGIIKALKEGEL